MAQPDTAECPPLDEATLRYLDRVFPDKCPRETDSDRKIWIAVGSRLVVDHLWMKWREQHEDGNVLEQ